MVNVIPVHIDRKGRIRGQDGNDYGNLEHKDGFWFANLHGKYTVSSLRKIMKRLADEEDK